VPCQSASGVLALGPEFPSPVMPGLDPGIHPSSEDLRSGMDCRVKPGNDENSYFEVDNHGDP
jgi:hypothetical protein